MTGAVRSRRVLLVEDNPGDADLARDALEQVPGDWQVEQVGRLSDGLAAIARVCPDVVLLDLTLPDASGLEALSVLTGKCPDVPIVVLTGMHDEELGSEAVRQGAQEYLLKGDLDARTLTRVLRYAVERHALARRAQALARENAARAVAEEARRRTAVLAEASVAIASTLEEEEVLARLARELVPGLGAFCAIEWLGAKDRMRGLIVTNGAAPRAFDLTAAGPGCAGHLRARCAPGARIQNGVPEPYPAWRDAWLHGRQGLDLRSAMVLPFLIRGEAVGALSIARAEAYAVEDLAVAEEIARRASAGLDGARLYRQALDAVRVRDDFISMAGHELRTPLMTLLLDVERMRKHPGADPGSLERTVERIARSGLRLRSLIDDLLDVSRIRSGRFLLDLSDEDLVPLVREVVDRYAAELARIGSRVEIRAVESAPGRWDRSRIQQVVANLLQNAIRYGQGRPIEIALGRAGNRASMSVRDHGCGIDPADHGRIFEQFAHASTSKRDGLGLGLWITRGIVEAHGGTITVESELEKGAEFRVELPCAAPPGGGDG